MTPDPGHDRATSPVTGIILMVAVTILLACIILSQLQMLPYTLKDPEVPAIFKITKIRHTNEKGVLNYDSYMVVINSGEIGYKNQDMYAKTYRNGIVLDCVISTINGYKFIDGSHHFGVQNLAGFGAKGATWYPNAMIWIDYKDKTFHPGDEVTFEVYDNSTKQIISRHRFLA